MGNEPDTVYVIAWFIDAEDYEACHRIERKRGKHLPGYERWRLQAEKLESVAAELGDRTHRVLIDPDKVIAWCVERGKRLDRQAIDEYVLTVAHLGGPGEIEVTVLH